MMLDKQTEAVCVAALVHFALTTAQGEASVRALRGLGYPNTADQVAALLAARPTTEGDKDALVE